MAIFISPSSGGGTPGADGKTILNGTGAPAGGLGVDGDFYIDTTADAIYGPKTGGSWGSPTSLIGPTGATGDTGPQGPAGATGATGSAGVVTATAPITYDAGTQTVGISAATTNAAGSMSAADKTKLDGIASGATANATDAQLRDRSTHTGTQAAGTITGLATVATSGAYADLSGKPTLGGAAALNVGTSAGTVAAGDDSRLSDARTPTAHNQAWSTITSTPTTLSGYGITDAQPLDADLTSIAGLTTTSYGRSQLTLADAAADTAQLNVFSSTLKGLTPASGGGTTNFLRADGTWATPGGVGGGDAYTSNPLSQFAATTSAQLAGVISDETGSGSLVFANSPTLVTPALGTPASGNITNCTGSPQLTAVGIGVAPASGVGLQLAVDVMQLRSSLTAASGVYTIDVLTGNEFVTGAAINGATTINLSNLDGIPSGYVWRGVLTFSYTSGAITWFSGNAGYTVKWDGGTAVTPTASDVETVVITVVGGTTTIEVAALRGRA